MQIEPMAPMGPQPRRPAAPLVADRIVFHYPTAAERAANALAAATLMERARVSPTFRDDAVLAFAKASAAACVEGSCECVCNCHGGTFCDEAEPRFGHSRSVNTAHKAAHRSCSHAWSHNRK